MERWWVMGWSEGDLVCISQSADTVGWEAPWGLSSRGTIMSSGGLGDMGGQGLTMHRTSWGLARDL